jgi:hypothetical protein
LCWNEEEVQKDAERRAAVLASLEWQHIVGEFSEVGSSRMAAAHCCELLQVLRSIPATRLPGDPAAAETRLTCGA